MAGVRSEHLLPLPFHLEIESRAVPVAGQEERVAARPLNFLRVWVALERAKRILKDSDSDSVEIKEDESSSSCVGKATVLI